MKINVKTLLGVFGIDFSQPIEVLAEVVGLVGKPALAAEMKAHVTDARRAELATEFRGIADALDKSDFDTAAADLLAVLQGIK